MKKIGNSRKYSFRVQKGVKKHPGMIQDLFLMILVEYYIEKWENVLKFTFHGFAAHLKDYVSARFRILR